MSGYNDKVTMGKSDHDVSIAIPTEVIQGQLIVNLTEIMEGSVQSQEHLTKFAYLSSRRSD